jgi:hypothetical protein
MFMKHDIEKARTLKLIITASEQLSGLKISFHKSEFFCFGEAQDDANLYDKLISCVIGQFSISYLGILIHFWWLTIVECKHVEEKLQMRLIGKLLYIFEWKIGPH